ncbi:SRA stem-loop-interacting RNA-binding protein, mitochondrial-like [Lycorma delicatula]|uniref:SRA stem-loop-interacting RNA-binding protein, mitochondrial-like n=1 Tax=Lycorma delicatula TaxID=130591 RepID=UPI003F5146CA
MASVARSLRKVFVGGLPWTVGTNELRQYFSEFGHVVNAFVIFDRNTGLSRGYGFVTFGNPAGFNSALNQQKHILEGNVLQIQPAN